MADSSIVFVGNWDRHKSAQRNGLARCIWKPADGTLQLAGCPVAPEITVGAVCVGPKGDVLYCVDEYDILPGNFVGGGGQVLAFAIDRASGALRELSRQPSLGSLPSGVAVDTSGRFMIVVHHTDRNAVTQVRRNEDGTWQALPVYDDATTVLFRLGEDGAIEEACDVYFHLGDGGPLRRQTHPQLHSVTASPDGCLFAVCDKGNDLVEMFAIDAAAAKLRRPGRAHRAPPGSSPRYVAFHPTRPFMFLNHETSAIISTLRFSDTGELTHVSTVDVLPPEIADAFEMKQSDIRVHPNGRWLYSLIRGISAVSVFAIDQADGTLERIQTASLDAEGPRGCAISPDGRFLLVAALAGRRVAVWSIADDGTLAPTGHGVDQPNPGTVTFVA